MDKLYTKEQIAKAVAATWVSAPTAEMLEDGSIVPVDMPQEEEDDVMSFFYEQLDIAAGNYKEEELITVLHMVEEKCSCCNSHYCEKNWQGKVTLDQMMTFKHLTPRTVTLTRKRLAKERSLEKDCYEH
jgi:hypothetical protein